jgi:hypothetical protein
LGAVRRDSWMQIDTIKHPGRFSIHHAIVNMCHWTFLSPGGEYHESNHACVEGGTARHDNCIINTGADRGFAQSVACDRKVDTGYAWRKCDLHTRICHPFQIEIWTASRTPYSGGIFLFFLVAPFSSDLLVGRAAQVYHVVATEGHWTGCSWDPAMNQHWMNICLNMRSGRITLPDQTFTVYWWIQWDIRVGKEMLWGNKKIPIINL